MAVLVPFRALRPAPAAASRVAAVPYDVVGTDEARALAAGNALSFLHVSRPEIDLPSNVDPHSDAAYAQAVRGFDRLKRDAPLVLDEEPRLYVYRLRAGAHVQTGVAGCYAVDDYDRGVIRKHERTRRDKEDDRTRHMIALEAQTGPVFLTYRESATVEALLETTIRAVPALYDFETDGVQHTIWMVSGDVQRDLLAAFALVPALYIADGHHRAASASRARAHFRGAAGTLGEWDTFLAVAFADTQVKVLAYNRVVADLGGQTPEAFIAALRQPCAVTAGSGRPARAGEVSMFVSGAWHTLTLKPPLPSAGLADRLDVTRLQNDVLGPLLGIGDPRTDPRIDFVGGGFGTLVLEALVSSGRAAVAFSLFPVNVADLMAISDAGGIMPPKSTWFEPKLRDGLLSHMI